MMLKVVSLNYDLQPAEYAMISYDSEKPQHITPRSSTIYPGRNFTITYSKIPFGNNSDYGIALFVSAVELVTHTNTACLSTTSSNWDGNTTLISNLDIENGYKVNSGCSSKVPEKKKNIISLLPKSFFYERYGDMLWISYAPNLVIGLIIQEEVVIENVGDIDISFSPDGSVVGAGFEIVQKYISCTCGPSVVTVPCNGSVYLTVTETINSYSYCSNMNCSFSIAREGKCSVHELSLTASVMLRTLSNDSLIIKVDGKTSESFNSNSTSVKTMSFPPNAKVEVDFTSETSDAIFYPAPYVMLRFTDAGDIDQGEPQVCSTSYNDTLSDIYYTNFDRKCGYPNNFYCNVTVIFEAGKNYFLTKTKDYYEYIADSIVIKDLNGESYQIVGDMTFEPKSDKKYSLEFSSDDSVFQGGFELRQLKRDCSCPDSPIVILCDSDSFDTSLFNNEHEYGYCSSMNCSRNIVLNKICSNSVWYMTPYVYLRPNTSDTLLIYIDGILNFLPHNVVTLKFTSDPSPAELYPQPELRFTLGSYPVLISQVELNKASPVHVVEYSKISSDYTNVTVPQGYTLEVYLALDDTNVISFSPLEVYDGGNYVGNLSAFGSKTESFQYIPLKYSSKSGNIMIGTPQHYRCDCTFFFRIYEIHSKNCQGPNIFQFDFKNPQQETLLNGNNVIRSSKAFHGISYSDSYFDPTAPTYPYGAFLSPLQYPNVFDFVFTCRFLDLGPKDTVFVGNASVTSEGQRSDGQQNGLWFAFTNGFSYFFDIEHIDKNVTKLKPENLYNDYNIPRDVSLKYTYYRFPHLDYVPWQAFQAVVYAPQKPNLKTNCWLSDQVFSLSNETEIIPIISFEISEVSELCLWHFTVPEGFYLKTNTMHWTTYGDEKFVVISSTGSSQEIRGPGVTYTNGRNFTIRYNRIPHSQDGTGIVAFVSISRTSATNREDCIIQENYKNGTINLSMIDYQKGYSNNIRCYTSLDILNNGIYELRFPNRFVEQGADKIQLTNPNGNKYLLTGDDYLLNTNTAYFPNTLEFASDGSVVGAGFQMVIEKKNCDCSPKDVLIPCNGSYSLLDITAGGKITYCSGMDCSWKFISNPECPGAAISFMVFPNLRYSVLSLYFDQFGLFVDGKMRHNFTSSHRTESRSYLFEYGTSIEGRLIIADEEMSQVFEASSLTVYFTHVQLQKSIHVQLTNENPTFAVSLTALQGSALVTVDAPPVDILELFVATNNSADPILSSYTLYDGGEKAGTLNGIPLMRDTSGANRRRFTPESISKRLASGSIPMEFVSEVVSMMPISGANLPTPPYGDTPMKFSSTSGRFAIFTDKGQNTNLATLFFRGRISHKGTCLNLDNVFQCPLTSHSISLNTDKLCGYTFINYGQPSQGMKISNLQQNSQNSPRSFFSPDFNRSIQYFSFEDSTASSWNNTVLKGLYNTLFMESSNVYMRIQYSDSSFTDDENLNGVLYSENYGRPYVSLSNNVSYALGTFNKKYKSAMTFTCQAIDNGYLQITQSGKSYTIESPDQSVVIDTPGLITSLIPPFQLPLLNPLTDLSMLPDLLKALPGISPPGPSAPLSPSVSSGLSGPANLQGIPGPLRTPEEQIQSVARAAEENNRFYQRAAANIPAPKIESCEEDYNLIVIAVSTTPYSPDTIVENLTTQRRSMRLLEAFTGSRISRFGPYTEESINLEGLYAYKIAFEQVDDCNEAKEFTTKAVSYSKHIERAFFKCRCENLVISKLHK
ncbi:hypothetical protein FO519_004625 [Halicephalobus sp. NKZ332]|nr:hypothetical protein FO519_004625 [Halicephalobus sp. NKZ332]